MRGRWLWMLLLAGLCLAGCGNPDRGRQAETQQIQEIQAQQGKASGSAQTEWDGKQADAQEDKNKKDAKDAKAGGKAKEEDAKGQDAEAIQAAQTEAAEDGGKYKAEFLGIDSSVIQGCTIYHGDSQEEIDLSSASGKYLLQMLSNFFEDPKYEYGELLGIIDLENISSLEQMAKDGWVDYYIYLPLGQTISHSLVETMRCTTHAHILHDFDTVIVEWSEGSNDLVLYRNMSDGSFYPVGSYQTDTMADFVGRFKEWQKIEDWDAAFARLEEEKKDISERRAEMWTHLERPEQQENAEAEQEEANFLGIEAAQIQACKIYHGEGQEELDLSGDRGKSFLQMLSAFMGKQEFRFADGSGRLDEEYASAGRMGDLAKKYKNNYYIYFQFEQPASFHLKEDPYLEKNPNGMIWNYGFDELAIEVDKKNKCLGISVHYVEAQPIVALIHSCGARSKTIYQEFTEVFEAWDTLCEAQGNYNK